MVGRIAQLFRSVPLRGYSGYILRRLIVFVPLVFGISVFTFFLVRMLPGDPARVLAGSSPYPGVVESIKKRMGLDQPLPAQYLIYIKNAAKGDLGDSWLTGKPVADDMAMRAPATFELITFGMLAAISFGLVLGIAGALKPGGPIPA